jgi:ornithine cyclodeaminase
MKDILSEIEDVLRAQGEGRTVIAPRIVVGAETLPCVKMKGFMIAMAGYVLLDDKPMVGVKWLGEFEANPEKNLPVVTALTVINDPDTGLPLAVADGTLITAYRTGAVTAIGAKYLARRNSSTVAIVGAGAQGRTHLLALNELFRIQRVHVVDINAAVATKYAEEMSKATGLHISPMEDVRQAVEEAEIVIMATNANKPVLKGEWLRSGFFVGSIAMTEEFDDEVTSRADKIVVDDMEDVERTSLKSKFDRGVLSPKDVYAQLSEIVVGRKAGREHDEEETLLVTAGMPIEDVAVLNGMYQLAKKKGLGTPFKFL